MTSSLRSLLFRLLGMRVEAAAVTGHLQYPYEQKAKHLPEDGFYNRPVHWVVRQIWQGDEVPLG